jgi:hypothetical protein
MRTNSPSRNTRQAESSSNGNERLGRHGLSLPKPTLRALERNGIYCFPGVSIEHQHLARQFVLRGTESGGAVADLGRYCGYFDSRGNPLPWLQPLDSLGGNGRHAIVVADELVRVEMLRIGQTYDLLISKHELRSLAQGRRPALQSTVVFRGREGRLAIELWTEEHRHLRGTAAPIFYTGGGEIRQLPPAFEGAIRRVAGAVSCVRCKHTHVAIAPLAAAVEHPGMQEQHA